MNVAVAAPQETVTTPEVAHVPAPGKVQGGGLDYRKLEIEVQRLLRRPLSAGLMPCFSMVAAPSCIVGMILKAIPTLEEGTDDGN